MPPKRKSFSKEYKAKVALEAIKGYRQVNEIAQEYSVHPNQVAKWKKQLLENMSDVFDNKRGRRAPEDKSKIDQLYQQIGKLQVELDWLKKKHEFID